MKRQTRRLLLNTAVGVALVAAAAVVLLPATVAAAPATASGAVNVRQAPSTSAAILDQLHAGERVDVTDCRGSWCYVVHLGPDGWVAASYLDGISLDGAGSQPSIQFGFSIGPGGPSISLGIGNPPVDVGVGAVCFFDNTRYGGDGFCVDEGYSIRNLGEWSDRISSFRNPEGLDVTVCTRTSFRGACRTYSSGARNLGNLDDEISSLRVE